MNPWDRTGFARRDANRSVTRADICILALTALILVGAVAWIYNDTRMTCEVTLLTEAISPDGAWKAAQYQEYCQGFLVTTIAVEVHLVSTRDPGQSAVVLADSAYTEDERSKFVWTAPRTLQVDVPSSLFLNVITCEFEGVRIHVSLPQNDLANRAAWYRQLGKPDPDPGGLRARKCSANAAPAAD